MSNIIEEFFALLTWKVDDAALTEFNKKTKELGQNLKEVGNNIRDAAMPFMVGITAPVVALGVASAKAAGDLEMLQTNFETLLGDAEKGKQLTTDLQKMAAVTPYTSMDLAQASKTLLGYTVNAENLLPVLNELGDISMGSADNLSRLSLAFGQAFSLGRLQATETRQMVDAGYNPTKSIAKMLGKDISEIAPLMERGKISIDLLMQAMKADTSSGGLYFQGMIKASKTLPGLMSTVKDDMNIALSKVGGAFLEDLKKIAIYLDMIFKKIGAIAEWFEKLPKPLKETLVIALLLAAAFGPILWAVGSLISSIGSIALGMNSLILLQGTLKENQIVMALLSWATVWPYLAIIAAVVAIGAAIYLLLDDILAWKNGGVSLFGSFYEWIAKLGKNFVEFGNIIFNVWKIIIGLLLAPFRVAVELIIAGVVRLWNATKDFRAVIVDTSNKAIAQIKEKFHPAIEKISAIFNAIKNAVKSAKDSIDSFFKSMEDGINKVWNSKWIKDIGKTVLDMSDYGRGGSGGNFGATTTGMIAATVGGATTTINRNSIGDIKVSIAGTNASPQQIGNATQDAVLNALRTVSKQNGKS